MITAVQNIEAIYGWENLQNMEKLRTESAKQILMKCPDLSNTIIFERCISPDNCWLTGETEIVLEVSPTCVEYFEVTDPCNGVSCNENASCITKGKSFECSCNEGYIKTGDRTGSSGWVFN